MVQVRVSIEDDVADMLDEVADVLARRCGPVDVTMSVDRAGVVTIRATPVHLRDGVATWIAGSDSQLTLQARGDTTEGDGSATIR